MDSNPDARRYQSAAWRTEQGIKALVQDYIEEGFDKDKIIKKLQKRFTMSEDKAKEYYERFRQSE